MRTTTELLRRDLVVELKVITTETLLDTDAVSGLIEPDHARVTVADYGRVIKMEITGRRILSDGVRATITSRCVWDEEALSRPNSDLPEVVKTIRSAALVLGLFPLGG